MLYMPTKPVAHHFVRDPGLPHLELRTASDSRDCYQTHTHDEYSFGTIDAGRAVYSHGANHTALTPGMTVMMEPGLAHACNPDAEQAWSYRMLFVDAQWVHLSFLPLVDASHTPRLKLAHHSTDRPAVYKALSRIADALVSAVRKHWRWTNGCSRLLHSTRWCPVRPPPRPARMSRPWPQCAG